MSGNCVKCGVWRSTIHRDHIIPKCNGGPDTRDNIQLLCANCHEDKTNSERLTYRTPEERSEHARQMGLKHGARGGSKSGPVQGAKNVANGHMARLNAQHTYESRSKAGKAVHKRFPVWELNKRAKEQESQQ